MNEILSDNFFGDLSDDFFCNISWGLFIILFNDLVFIILGGVFNNLFLLDFLLKATICMISFVSKTIPYEILLSYIVFFVNTTPNTLILLKVFLFVTFSIDKIPWSLLTNISL